MRVARTGVDLCSGTATSGIARHVARLTPSRQRCARRRKPLANSLLATRGGLASIRSANDSSSAPTSMQVSACKPPSWRNTWCTQYGSGHSWRTQAGEIFSAHNTAPQKYQKPNSSSCTRGAGHGSKAHTDLVEHVPPSVLECTGSTEPDPV